MRDKPGHYLGINIGGTTCSVVLGDEAGKILGRRAWKTTEAADPEAAVNRIVEAGAALAMHSPPWAAGVAIGGPMNTLTGEILGPPNLPGWEQVPLKAILEERLGMPVGVEHDAAACALAEARFGGHHRCESLVYLTCGTGFGAGIVIAGRIYHGANGLHPEMGHWRLLEEGPEAFGRVGSAEALCSGPALARLASWLYPERWSASKPTPEDMHALALNGDHEALEVVDFHAKMTGRVCSLIAELLCPGIILLGSLARHMGNLWVEPVIRHYREEVLDRIGRLVPVAPATLGEQLQDLSALVVAMEAAAPKP